MENTSWGALAIYLAVMAGTTYLIRMIPFAAFRKTVKSTFLKSFLYYMPYAVLGAMTFPSIFYSTGSLPSAIAGTVVGLGLAFWKKPLLVVALGASASALLTTFAWSLIMGG